MPIRESHTVAKENKKKEKKKMEQSQRTVMIKKAASSLVLLGLMLAMLLAAAVPAFAQGTPGNQSPEPPGPPPSVEQTDLVAQLTVECPENIEASYTLVTTGVESRTQVVLTDEDGDGVYTGTQTFPKFPPGPQPTPGTGEPITVNDVRIVAPDGSTVKQFGPVKLDQDEIILPATISLCDDGGSSDNNGGGSDNSGGSSKGGDSVGGGAKTLPATGGALPIAGLLGALLVGSGLLVRRIAQ